MQPKWGKFRAGAQKQMEERRKGMESEKIQAKQGLFCTTSPASLTFSLSWQQLGALKQRQTWVVWPG